MIPAKIASIFIQITTQISGDVLRIDAGEFVKPAFKIKESIYKTCPFLEGTLDALEDNNPVLLEGMLIVFEKKEYNVDLELLKTNKSIIVLIHNRTSVYRFVDQLNQNRNDLFFLKREIKEKNKELETLRNIADEANKQKSRFLAMMSHEVRNPLNVILGYSKMISEEKINTNVKEYSKLLSLSGEHLKVIVNDILDLSRIEAGKLELVNLPINLKKIAKNCLENFKYQNTNNSVELVLNYDNNIPKKIVGDDVRIYQILSNLLSNALKFTEKGKVSLDVKLEFETTTFVNIAFLVSDSGRGMTEEQASKIFEEFTQNKKSDNRVFGGAGLGLSIVKRLLKAMNGKISVESSLNIGTTFITEIPFRKLENKTIFKDKIQHSVTKNLKDKRILVADDDALNQKIVSHILKDKQVKLTQAKDGLEALNHLKEDVFDLVLLDIHMPNVTGEQLVQQKTSFKKENSKIPFIALTANTTKEDLERYKLIGFKKVIGKPYTAKDFIQIIKSVL